MIASQAEAKRPSLCVFVSTEHGGAGGQRRRHECLNDKRRRSCCLYYCCLLYVCRSTRRKSVYLSQIPVNLFPSIVNMPVCPYHSYIYDAPGYQQLRASKQTAPAYCRCCLLRPPSLTFDLTFTHPRPRLAEGFHSWYT